MSCMSQRTKYNYHEHIYSSIIGIVEVIDETFIQADKTDCF